MAITSFILVAGCTTYSSDPLSEKSPLVTDLSALQVESDVYATHPANITTIDFGDGWNLTELGIVAAINNPALKAQRARLNVARAQVFSARLLPDPSITTSQDNPSGNTAGLVKAWSFGLAYELVPLITRNARVSAERSRHEQIRLELLWQEWQVVQRSRTLAVRAQLEEQKLVLLQQMYALYRERYRRSAAALEQGDITLDINGTDLTALVDTLSQLNQIKQTHNNTLHALNLVLGLDPNTKLTLAPLVKSQSIEVESAKERLGKLSHLRPDLLALQAGYLSQEAQVRAAVLAQFPAIGIGFNRARDTGAVKTSGFSVSLTLPLFGGNRGNIAIQRATREQLRAEFDARLAQTIVDVDRLLTLQKLLQIQMQNLQEYLPTLNTLVTRARRAYQERDIDALTFLNMESTWVNKQLEQISLKQASWENYFALQVLLALPVHSGDLLE